MTGSVGANILSGMAKGTQATQELDDLVPSSVVENLRALFGDNPTEGERSIFLAAQGVQNLPSVLRAEVYQRAIDAVVRRARHLAGQDPGSTLGGSLLSGLADGFMK